MNVDVTSRAISACRGESTSPTFASGLDPP